MRTVEEQLEIVLATTRRLGTERIPAADALGRLLAAPVLAAVDIPLFDNSAMDGFAVRAEDLESAGEESPVALEVVGEVPAGSPLDPGLAPGQAVRIMTGSAVPSSADAIVPVEDTREGFAAEAGGRVTVVRAPRRAAHIRRAAEDLRAGDVVVPAGVRFGPFQAGAVSAAGVAEVVVARRPRVAVVSTGSELVPPAEVALGPLGRGRIPESNSLLLADLVAEAGGAVVLRETVPDDPAALTAVLRAAFLLDVDAVIMSGGVSEGAYEPVKQALGPSGAMDFGKVSMQPGKPQGFGATAEGVLLFGFPGNPVSVAVSFECFARPALLAMQGATELHRPRIVLAAGTGWRTPRGRRQYLPSAIDRSDPARWTIGPATRGGSGSHLAGGLARAEAYAIVDAEADEVREGDPVTVMLVS